MITDKDLGFKKIQKLLKKEVDKTIQIGIFKEAGKNDGEYISEYAFKNEFGEGVPERSFLRSTMNENESKYQDFAIKTFEKTLDANLTANIIAEMCVDDVKKKIASNLPPPNSPETIKRKKSSKTLIDTGMMRNSVTYRVL